MTTKQPILDELHAVRERLLAESGGTLAGLVKRLRAEQELSERTILKTRRSAEPGAGLSSDDESTAAGVRLFSMYDAEEEQSSGDTETR